MPLVTEDFLTSLESLSSDLGDTQESIDDYLDAIRFDGEVAWGALRIDLEERLAEVSAIKDEITRLLEEVLMSG